MNRTRAGTVLAVLVLGALALWPLVTTAEGYQLQRLEYVLAVLMAAIGLNVVTGFAGQLSLGPGAIFAVGGYAAALLADHFPTHVGLLAMAVAGLVSGAVIGVLIGVPALRVGGFYLGMTTLFFALLVPLVAGNLAFTGKETGISLLGNLDFRPRLAGRGLYELTLLVVALLVLGSWLLLESRTGHRFVTLAASEQLASSLGIPGYRTKLTAFLLSALPAGLGGAFYAYTQQFISPGSVTPNLSIYLLAACVVGGFGTVLGPLVGGLLVIGLSQYLGSFAEYEGVIFGVLLMAFSIGLPEGLVGVGLGRARVAPSWTRALPAVARPRLPAPTSTPAASGPAARRPTPRAGGPGEVGLVADLLARAAPDLLAVTGARRAFRGVLAVDDVDLAVRPGTVHGLIGSNGSGKTTLLNLVSGFYSLDEGDVWLGATRLAGRPAHRVAAAGVARTFQTPKLLGRASLLANVVVAAERVVPGREASSVLRSPAGRRADREARQRALACLEAVGLADRAHERAGAQPHGVRRLAELARALAVRPAVMLLDEPAAGLSAFEVEVLGTTIRAVAAAGVGVLLVEHNVPLVLGLADEVTALHQGQRLATGSPQEVSGDARVARSFLGTAGPPAESAL